MPHRLTVLLIVLVGQVVLAATDVKITNAVAKEATLAYGYYLGQQRSLEKIAEKYPELALKSLVAEKAFASSFGDAVREIDRQMKNTIPDEWRKIKDQLKLQVANLASRNALTVTQAEQFTLEVVDRADGNIQSPVLETFLTFSPRYQEHPSEEFTDGYRQQYYNDGSGKAKGLAYQLQAPKSWKLVEGNRPNIATKFVSQNGRGITTFMVIVKRLGLGAGETITMKDVEELRNEDDILDFLPKGATFGSSGTMILEDQPGFWISYKMTMSRFEYSMDMQVIAYNLFYSDYMIQMQGQVGQDSGTSIDISKAFNRFRPLFNLVANSLVLPTSYSD
jgi:hypothetical protein